MFENYIKQAKQKVLEKYTKSNQFIYLRDILEQTTMSLAYKTYLTAEVNWWIYEEQMQRKINLNFNLEESTIAALFNDLDNHYFMNARFDLPGFKTVIDSAAKIRLNMAIRPRTTLKWFVFRGEPTKSYNEILLRLDYIADNRYIVDEFIRKVEDEKIAKSPSDIFSVIEFENLISEIDNKLIYDLSPESFTSLTDPIFDYFNFSDKDLGELEVPTESLIIFLDDKELAPLSKRLEDKYYNEDLKFMTKKDFLKFIYLIINETDVEQSGNEFSIPELNLQQDVIFNTDLVIPENLAGLPEIMETVISADEDLDHPEQDIEEFTAEDETMSVTIENQTQIEESSEYSEEITDQSITEYSDEVEQTQESDPELKETLQDDFEEIPEQAITEFSSEDIEILQTETEQFTADEDDSSAVDVASLLELEISPNNNSYRNTGNSDDFWMNELSGDLTTEEDTPAFENVSEIEETSTPETEDNKIDDTIIEEEFLSEVSPDIIEETPEDTTEYTIAEPIQEAPRRSASIPAGQAQKFIDNLFYSDSTEFNNLMEKVDQAVNFGEALPHINKFYEEYGIFPQAEISVEFLKTIKGLF